MAEGIKCYLHKLTVIKSSSLFRVEQAIKDFICRTGPAVVLFFVNQINKQIGILPFYSLRRTCSSEPAARHRR